MAQARAERDDELERARHPEDDADPRALDRLGGGGLVPARDRVAAILERLLGDDEPEQLAGVGRLEITRRDAEQGRLERDGVEEAAARRVDTIGCLGVGVEVVGGVPVGRRHVADGVVAVDDARPEGAEVRRAGEQASGADDGQGHHRRVGSRIQCDLSPEQPSSAPLSIGDGKGVGFSPTEYARILHVGGTACRAHQRQPETR